MRFSELNTDSGMDVLVEMTPYVLNIAADSEFLTELKRKAKLSEKPTEAEIKAIGAAKIAALVPIVLKKHRADVYGVLAALNNTTAEDIAVQNFLLTAKQLGELITDKEFIGFFKSLTSQDETA